MTETQPTKVDASVAMGALKILEGLVADYGREQSLRGLQQTGKIISVTAAEAAATVSAFINQQVVAPA